MGLIKAIQGAFAFLNKLLGNIEKSENLKSGGEKVDLENRKAYDKSRDKAKDLGSRKHTGIKSSGMHRKPTDGNTKR